jgi:hypothetical protein
MFCESNPVQEHANIRIIISMWTKVRISRTERGKGEIFTRIRSRIAKERETYICKRGSLTKRVFLKA